MTTPRDQGPLAIAIFGSAYFDEPLWTNKQHVAARLAARGHRVLYVEPGFAREIVARRLRGGASPLSLRRDAWARAEAGRRGIVVPDGRLHVLSPVALPLRRGPTALVALAYWVLGRLVARHAARIAPGSWVLTVYYPDGVRLIEALRPRVVAYDCVDDLLTQPHVASHPRVARRIEAAERLLLARADVVLATSIELVETRQRHNPRTYYVPNVADYAHFAKAAGPVEEPADIAPIPHPRLTFVGALDTYKVDYNILEALARDGPDLHLVLVGPAQTTGPNPRLAPLLALPNVHHLGTHDYSVLPRYLGHSDVLLLPYAHNAHTRCVFPIKFFEFLATGRPVIASALPSLAEHERSVPMPRDTAGWLTAVRAALSRPGEGRVDRMALAALHTWDRRVDTIEALLCRAMADAGARSPG